MQGMCGVLATPPDAFASVPGLVAALPQVILMPLAIGSSTSQPQQLDLSSGCANVHESWITAKKMSARGRDMPPHSSGVTCIYSPDVAVHRRRPPELPIDLDQLLASRVLAEANFVHACFPGASQLHAR